MTTPELFRRIEALFHRALDLAPGERKAFLDSACGSDDGLRGEVEKLLAEADGSQPLLAGLSDHITRMEEPLGPGERIGRYRIVRLIGEGGMGRVFEAEQEEPIRRTVATRRLRTAGGRSS